MTRSSSPEPSDSPLDRPTRAGTRVTWVALAVAVHAAVLLGAAYVPHQRPATAKRQSALVSRMVEIELEPAVEELPPEPEVEPPPEPEPPPPVVRKRVPAPKPVPPPPEPKQAEPPPEPPAEPPPEEAPAAEAAAAADLMVAEESAPVDFGDTLVVGNADKPVGGVTAAGGTATTAVRDQKAIAGGVEGGTGTAKAPAPDLSRPAGLAGGARWDCPFPREADFAGVDQAAVVLAVKVDASGSVQEARVHDDPGHGFGREARRCAMRKRWQPELDKSGQAKASQVYVRVRFNR